MKIIIVVINHSNQRYPTVGDWQWDLSGNLHITVSNMSNWKYHVLVGLHEFIEVLLCRDRGITQGQVDHFDTEYEKNRPEDDDSEPGDHPDAPYRKEHQFATKIEKMFARELDVDWKEYSDKVNSL